ncbi:MAG: tyrosine-type recombinase/integrase [Lachnospiraceae bacterium]|nr:tyrosine-type recombinase/integrase [Lachnospiraceae bacterium]
MKELVGLDTKSIDFRNGMITVTLKGGNDGHSFFGPEVESALRDYIENGRPLLKPTVNDDALFLSVRHQRITVCAVELLVKDYTERAEIANADRITPHKLRATYGTQLYEQSGDIKLVASTLHHKSIETTSKHYVKDSEEQHDQVVKYSSRLFQE